MLVNTYRKAIRDLYDRIDETQTANMEAAAKMITEAVQAGGDIHVFDTGHIINSELINRAGGLALLRSLNINMSIINEGHERDRSGKDTSQEGLGEYFLRQSQVMPGDVLILGSVSGKTVRVLDLAIAARSMGVKTIAVTSLTYSSSLKSDHSCGKRLFELCDLVIDNCAPKGDAMIDYEGLDAPFGPASGLGSAYIMWQVSAMVTEQLLKEGTMPTVLKSVNYPDGPKDLETRLQRYKNYGY